MKRLRALAAVLGCLAMLAAALMSVAAAATPSSAPPATQQSAVGEQPCNHCDDCGGPACPAPMATCLQACAGVAPSLAAAAFHLPAIETGEAHRPPPSAPLRGLSPPPDPFPPRA